jgi:hypothetical protein
MRERRILVALPMEAEVLGDPEADREQDREGTPRQEEHPYEEDRDHRDPQCEPRSAPVLRRGPGTDDFDQRGTPSAAP